MNTETDKVESQEWLVMLDGKCIQKLMFSADSADQVSKHLISQGADPKISVFAKSLFTTRNWAKKN